MFWRNLTKGLLAGVLVTGAALPARADHHGSPCPPADCGPAYKTVYVKEWVPEQYESTRTTYRTEWKEEKYTAYRTECVPETRTHTYTVNVMKPETRVETRTVTECVPVVEQRTVMQSHVVCKPVTTMARRCVDRGHWECRVVEVKPHLLKRLRNHFHKNDCCDPCDPCCCKPVETKVVRCWVPNKVWEEYPVTKMVKVCEQRPVTCNVTVYKPVTKQIQVNVTVCKCVPETRTATCTVMVRKCVPYEACRKVAVCVPMTEKVMCTRMVCRTVAKQVPCVPCCEEVTCCKPRHRLLGLFGGHGRHGHGSSCCD